MTILVTGSEGLIGRELCERLAARGGDVRPFDIARSRSEDIRHADVLAKAVKGAEGVVHLAAVSRVAWGEQNPDLCVATNVVALQSLLETCLNQVRRPWMIFVSSREVYGNSDRLPVYEDEPLRPLNVYARSKYDGERLVAKARMAGLCVNTCRLSNVYGSTADHADRVVPAFASVAAFGGRMRVEGSNNLFDFADIVDVGRAIELLIEATAGRELLPTIHFATGIGTTLGQLAQLAAMYAKAPVEITDAPKRDYNVTRFVGDPSRAAQLLGWRANIMIDAGMRDLVERFRRERAMQADLKTAMQCS